MDIFQGLKLIKNLSRIEDPCTKSMQVTFDQAINYLILLLPYLILRVFNFTQHTKSLMLFLY